MKKCILFKMFIRLEDKKDNYLQKNIFSEL